MGRGPGAKAISKTSIEISFVFEGQRHRERIPLAPTVENLARATAHRAEILKAIEAGTFDYTITFPDSKKTKQILADRAADAAAAIKSIPAHTMQLTYLRGWLAHWIEKKRAELKSSTFRDYQKSVSLWSAWLGDFLLTDITKQLIKNTLEKEVPASTQNKRLSNLQSALSSALTDAIPELLENNPLTGWRYRRPVPAKKQIVEDEDEDIDPFSADEQARILAALDGQSRNFVQFAFWTGLRTSELIGLDWRDIDFSRGEVKIRRAMTQAAAGQAERPKTAAGRRNVKLLPAAIAALKDQQAYTYSGEGDVEVFQNPRTQQRWQGDQPVRKTMWKPALERAGVRYRYPYQTRHTYASMMLSANEAPMWVAQQMGHSDWSMIARRYGKFIPTAGDQSGQKAAAAFATAVKQAKKV